MYLAKPYKLCGLTAAEATQGKEQGKGEKPIRYISH